MANIATPSFLNSLKAIYPAGGPSTTAYPGALSNPWVIITAVAFSASNVPEAVPVVFKHALEELKTGQKAQGIADDVALKEQLVLARKIREGVLQSGLLSGFPRTINTLIALNEVMPEGLRESKPLRDSNKHMTEYDKSGEKLFRSMYRDTADSVQGLLDSAYPDLGWWCNTIGYGVMYGGADVLTQVESSYAIVAALIAVDAPRQVGWHLANARHGSASLEEARAVRRIAMEVAQLVGVTWKNGVPEVEP
ncbi:hypothetical protein TRAPUB_10419 [Trametes pubescens]|uniref:Carboxymuconolactone decarboxylase-like domain-containing protein n=1 Tax=Trametes pubescens TaxID=154538 RepID=A0A1M2VZQ1_TRAPU|nr:hypothetical protein TRAPUB_10419 [Trametes pubescens]